MSELTLATEAWLPVVGYEGCYEVSDLGRVRSLDRKTRRGVRPGRVLRPAQTGIGGHLGVNLSLRGEQITKRIHRLVIEAFVGPRPEGLQCCHNDGNPRNNRVENLRWDTQSSNMQDMFRHGTRKRAAPRRVLPGCSQPQPKPVRIKCPLEHYLVYENLVAHKISSGRRTCLSCTRAAASRDAARKRGEEFDFEAAAHGQYRTIMRIAS